MLDLVDDDQTSFKAWTRRFSKVNFLSNDNLNLLVQEFDYDFPSSVQTITLFAEFFNMVDGNGNGFVTVKEIESLFDSNVRLQKATMNSMVNLIDFRISQ